MNVERIPLVLTPESRRVLFRPYDTPPHRGVKIVARVMSMSDAEADANLAEVVREFAGRHRGLEQLLARRFEQVRRYLVSDADISRARRLLLGAYFSQEYTLESAGLFNPSIIWHPDQSGVPAGARRFVLSLRAVGEGHLSSITFRSGLVTADGEISIDPPQPFVTTPDVAADERCDKEFLRRVFFERDILDAFATRVLERLDDTFTWRELETVVELCAEETRRLADPRPSSADDIRALTRANYDVLYPAETGLAERVVFPYSPTESNGIEDARFVHFVEDDGSSYYVATYTAWDGELMFPQLLTTEDFLRFQLRTLNGPQAQNKGMALFPRRIDGRYAILSRQDNENLHVMFSDSLYFWYERAQLIQPTYPWEFVQIGNSGSPVETEAGWLVLIHGVGPMRKYSLGAILLDRDDPTRVIGRLHEPLLTPNENEREGYVPNVVYTCGCIVHGGRLIIPYATGDYATTFATVPLDELIDELVHPPATAGRGRGRRSPARGSRLRK